MKILTAANELFLDQQEFDENQNLSLINKVIVVRNTQPRNMEQVFDRVKVQSKSLKQVEVILNCAQSKLFTIRADVYKIDQCIDTFSFKSIRPMPIYKQLKFLQLYLKNIENTLKSLILDFTSTSDSKSQQPKMKFNLTNLESFTLKGQWSDDLQSLLETVSNQNNLKKLNLNSVIEYPIKILSPKLEYLYVKSCQAISCCSSELKFIHINNSFGVSDLIQRQQKLEVLQLVIRGSTSQEQKELIDLLCKINIQDLSLDLDQNSLIDFEQHSDLGLRKYHLSLRDSVTFSLLPWVSIFRSVQILNLNLSSQTLDLSIANAIRELKCISLSLTLQNIRDMTPEFIIGMLNPLLLSVTIDLTNNFIQRQTQKLILSALVQQNFLHLNIKLDHVRHSKLMQHYSEHNMHLLTCNLVKNPLVKSFLRTKLILVRLIHKYRSLSLFDFQDIVDIL